MVTVSVWFRFEDAFVYVVLIVRRELWSEWLLMRVRDPCIQSSDEGRLRFEANLDIVARVKVIWAWQLR